LFVAPTPTDDRIDAGAKLTFDLAVWDAFAAEQDDASAKHISLRRSAFPDDGFQPLPIACPQPQPGRRGKGHDRTSMFSFQFHLLFIGTIPSNRQHSRTIYETRY